LVGLKLLLHFYAIEELRTLAYEISVILNFRSLCTISENAECLEVLTPAHFLKASSYKK